MKSRDDNSANEPCPAEGEGPSADPLTENEALREAIRRIMSEEPTREPLNDLERQERVAALRQEIEAGAYMSDEKIVDIVDRLMRKWNL